MIFTADSANKHVKRLQEEVNRIRQDESENMTYSYFEGETPRVPEYDFCSTRTNETRLNNAIVALKHAIRVFNVNTKLAGMDITVDEAIVKMAMLSNKKHRLDNMLSMPKFRRNAGFGKGSVSEYIEVNFDPNEVRVEYDATVAELERIQTALNHANMTFTFEVDIPSLI